MELMYRCGNTCTGFSIVANKNTLLNKCAAKRINFRKMILHKKNTSNGFTIKSKTEIHFHLPEYVKME